MVIPPTYTTYMWLDLRWCVRVLSDCVVQLLTNCILVMEGKGGWRVQW